jgi:hypothetical protein
VLALGFFAASFGLHIVGGATGQGWLFAIAVALIYVSATGFAGIAAWLSGRSRATGDLVLFGWGIAGVAFTTGALWAANGRAFAWWEVPAAIVLETSVSGGLLFARRSAPATPAG